MSAGFNLLHRRTFDTGLILGSKSYLLSHDNTANSVFDLVQDHERTHLVAIRDLVDSLPRHRCRSLWQQLGDTFNRRQEFGSESSVCLLRGKSAGRHKKTASGRGERELAERTRSSESSAGTSPLSTVGGEDGCAQRRPTSQRCQALVRILNVPQCNPAQGISPLRRQNPEPAA
jgi:hypothetical protein